MAVKTEETIYNGCRIVLGLFPALVPKGDYTQHEKDGTFFLAFHDVEDRERAKQAWDFTKDLIQSIKRDVALRN